MPIGDSLNHKKTVQKRIAQLHALNDIIEERTEEANLSASELQTLKERIAEIKSLFPDLSEEEAINLYFQSLKERNKGLEQKNTELDNEIASKKEELNALLKEIKIATGLSEIVLERRTLEQEQAKLAEYKNSHIKVEDILFVGYYLSGSTIGYNAFTYFSDTTFMLEKSKYEQPGVLYKSLGDNRIVGFSKDLKMAISFNYDDTGVYINTGAKVWVPFTDACISVGSGVYLKGTVNVSEIQTVFKAYFHKNEFTPSLNGMNITRK